MATVNPTKHLTNFDEWHRMGEANIFSPESRVELINGEIYDVAQASCSHAGHLMRINKIMSQLIPNDILLGVHSPLQLGDLSEPQPDFMLLKANTVFYTSRHPIADDVLLLVEIADSSLAFDQTQKLRLYALHGVAEYWLLNLNNLCLEVYREPHGESYAQKSTLRKGDTVTLSQPPNISIQIADIL